MMLICYPITAFDGQDQFINQPNECLKMFDTTKKEDSMNAFLMLLAQFGNNLQYYNMSSRSQSSYFENIDNLFDDINSQEIDFEGLWCVLLNIEEEDVRKVLNGYKRDFVLVDKPTETPITFGGKNKDTMVVYGDFEDVMDDKDDNDELFCLLSVKNPSNENEFDVHIFLMKFEDVKEVGAFKSSTKNDKEWFENSYDALCGLYTTKKKMYLVQYHYNNGHHFEGDIYNELFETENDAMNALREEAKNVEKEFNEIFGDGEWEKEDRGDYICLNFNYYEDYWEGKVEELEVK